MRIIPHMLALFALAACSPGEGGADGGTKGLAVQPGARAPAAVVPMADSVAGGTRGLVYVPVYSHIYDRDHNRRIDLAVTVSIRNTDPEREMEIVRARYYDTGGLLLHEYVAAPSRLAPLASAEYVVARADDRGGAGANFLVEWRAARPVTEPAIEAVMIGTEGGQGISFLSVGRPLVRR